MAPAPIPGEPRESPKPQPIGNMPTIILFTVLTSCCLFILWRRLDTLRGVVSHQLKTFTHSEGRIRLSEDDGPSATEFLEDDYDEDNEMLDGNNSDDEPLTEHIRKSTQVWREPREDEGSVKVLPGTPR
ncbi:hypothetical protein BDQ12DRAFT_686697 [Crucibulum laeve]|uniref:Uncharacterized protein n=1 Tax=Crucibulum laeve TaxID=68775 RepID=A0A5C3LXG6_9AGAR|nr:hypothetical protein BDQ12DRAFT_686697 [Crucibulum laeve]